MIASRAVLVALRARLAQVALLAALAALAAAAGCGGSQAGVATGGASAPDFALRDLDGQTVHLSDYLGKKVVLLNFWATWCTPCQGEIPHLEALHRKFGADGFVVLGIAMDGPETIATVLPTARRLGVSYPVLLDEETRVVGLYNPKLDAPFNVFIGRDGNIASTRQGYTAGDESQIEAEVVRLLGAAAKAAAAKAAAPRASE
ncbi:MAG: TlpA family protein disulfide reductase [Myxococcales bacterium]|nr:TlpA family protein disulfide reductase [Myxococcales bacterium]